jgi:hypothetical protein
MRRLSRLFGRHRARGLRVPFLFFYAGKLVAGGLTFSISFRSAFISIKSTVSGVVFKNALEVTIGRLNTPGVRLKNLSGWFIM